MFFFLFSTDFFKDYFFTIFFQEHYQSVKQFGLRFDRTFCWAWSGSKLLAKVISNPHPKQRVSPCHAESCKFGNFREGFIFVKIKLSRYGEITLLFTDICKSCPGRGFWMLQICLLTLILTKISEFTASLYSTLVLLSNFILFTWAF